MNVPSYIPPQLKSLWQESFSAAVVNVGPVAATVVANKAILEKVPVVQRSADTLVPISFTISGEQLISRTEDGEDYLTAVLSDTQPYYVPNKHGTFSVEQFTQSVLQKFADTINAEQLVGDVDHQFYDHVLKQNYSDSMIKRALKQKPGIAKAVKAVVENGKLFLRLLVDKRYRKVLEKARGLSLEALVSKDANGTVTDGTLLGFTFAVNQTPVNQRAVVYG